MAEAFMYIRDSIVAVFALAFGALADGLPAGKPWSFRPLEQVAAPEVRDEAWPQTRIDRFILADIESAGLEPASEADARTLLRRLHFDLTGLPPTAAEVADFTAAYSLNTDPPSPHGYVATSHAVREAIDRLLASPHYGERWARHWLDLARYTDKTASWLESTAAAWLYRDWVVDAFNQDLPYDEFVKRQLANDLIPGADPKDNAALGFLGLSPTYWKELQLPPDIIKGTVADEWEEHVDALGKTFLGLTLGCARCHDHKTDPITMRDYYAIAGVFASVKFADRPTMSEELWAPVAKARARVAALQKQLADLKKKKAKDLKEQTARINKEIAAIKAATPHYNMATVNGVAEAALYVVKNPKKHGTVLDYKMGEARDLPMHQRGDPNKPGDVVPRGFIEAFARPGKGRLMFKQGSGRLELAQGIVEDAAPLAARVMVNRVWAHHFGKGLVGTPSELGRSGDRPTHPALLDDLAARFVANGWSIKWLHREILLSATWRQASVAPESEAKDPDNRHYARMTRRRLDVEAWRDSMLWAVGGLEPALGGASEDLEKPTSRRRTIYGAIHRRDINKMLRLHDFPDPTAHAGKRARTTTPLQMLFTLNGPFMQRQSDALAMRLLALPENSVEARVGDAYERLFQRAPSERETSLAAAFLKGRENDKKAWAEYAQALLGGNEFLYVD